MSRVIVSPVKRWPGTVTISDPLSLPQEIAFEDALAAAKEVDGGRYFSARVRQAILTGVRACVEAWNLEGGFTPEPFPATPPASSAALMAWLVSSIDALYQEAEPDPNE